VNPRPSTSSPGIRASWERNGVEVAVAPGRCLNDAVVALADADGCGPPVVVDRKGEIERLVGFALVGGGCEALQEPDAGGEGERALRS